MRSLWICNYVILCIDICMCIYIYVYQPSIMNPHINTWNIISVCMSILIYRYYIYIDM